MHIAPTGTAADHSLYPRQARMAEVVRRGRLKIDCRKACGFESRSGYSAGATLSQLPKRTRTTDPIGQAGGRPKPVAEDSALRLRLPARSPSARRPSKKRAHVVDPIKHRDRR